MTCLRKQTQDGVRLYGVLARDPLSTLMRGTQYVAACTADVVDNIVVGWRYGCYTYAPDAALQGVLAAQLVCSSLPKQKSKHCPP